MKDVILSATRPAMLAVAVAIIVVAGAPALAYQTLQTMRQDEARDPTGKITVEAAIIHVVQCNGPGENGGQYYIYQYTKRTGFRAIQPPNWGSPIGGRDVATFEEAAGAACRGAGASPDEPIPPPRGPDLPLR